MVCGLLDVVKLSAFQMGPSESERRRSPTWKRAPCTGIASQIATRQIAAAQTVPGLGLHVELAVWLIFDNVRLA